MRGFAPPAPGTAMCRYRVVYGPSGRLKDARPCARAAASGTEFCQHHLWTLQRLEPLEVTEGGFCFFCAAPARTYAAKGMRLALCGRHGKALGRLLR